MQQRFELDLPALVAVLRDHLYSEPRIVVRELVQNARDSILQLGLLRPHGRISVRTDPDRLTLRVADNGVGMTAQQAQSNLAVLAHSGTRLLRARPNTADPKLVEALGGQFGIGFFTTLMVSEQVEVFSRPRTAGAPAVHWVARHGSCEYALEECEWPGPGTEVVLTLTPRFASLAEPETIRRLLVRYCDLVEFPIQWNDEPLPVNRMRPPWRDGPATREVLVRFLLETGRLQPDEEPLFADCLPPDGLCRGMLFLPAKPADAGKVALYSRNMFVNEDGPYFDSGLEFLHGVIECDDLPLTLSRDGVVAGPALNQFRDALRAAALATMSGFRRLHPTPWHTLVQAYARPMKIAALQDRQVMDVAGDDLPLRLAGGESMPAGEILRHSPERVLYFDKSPGQTCYVDAFAAAQRLVVDATDRVDWLLLHRLSYQAGKESCRVDGALDDLAQPAEGSRWRLLERVTAALDPEIEPRAVELPSALPALLAPAANEELAQAISEARSAGMDVEALEALRAALVRERRLAKRVLFLNTRHGLPQVLATSLAREVGDEELQLSIRSVIASARACLEASGSTQAWQMQAEALTALIQAVLERPKAQRQP